MGKNITVFDENMNILESTYPKRANGLVKHNRARWIDDNAICLFARPVNGEEKKMTNNIYEIFDNQLSKMQEQLKAMDSQQAVSVRMMILKTLETVKAQEQTDKVIDIVKEQLDFLKSSITDEMPEMCESEAQPQAVQGIIMCRETTKQRLIALSEKLLDVIAQKPPMPEPSANQPMNPAGGNPPMNPAGGNPPMNPAGGNPPMNPAGGNPPMNPAGGNPPMNPAGGNPPMNPAGGNPPMNPPCEPVHFGEPVNRADKEA